MIDDPGWRDRGDRGRGRVPRVDDAYFADVDSQRVPDRARTPLGPLDHPANRQVRSTKGLIADDQIPVGLTPPFASTAIRDPSFAFLCEVLGHRPPVHPYADAPVVDQCALTRRTGRELGWHFDNSSFAVTLLLQAPQGGGRFEYVGSARDSAARDQGFPVVDAVLDGDHPVADLAFEPGDLVIFRGRDALHRVTPTEGPVTRLLVVFAFNDEPGIRLSDSALQTFYGRSH